MPKKDATGDEAEERLFTYIAVNGLPFRHIEIEVNREFLNIPEGLRWRKTFVPKFVAAGKAKLEAAIAQLRKSGQNVTLAVDSGTVWRRYVAVVAVTTNSPPLLVALASDETFPDGRQTGENIAEYLQKLLQTTLAGVNVVGFVGDNASSLQLGFSLVQRAAAAGDLAEQFEDNERTMEFGVFDTAGKVDRDDVRAAQILSWFPGKYFRVRCFAHSIQLVVKELIARNFPTLEEVALRARAIHGVTMRPVQTRWNYLYLLVKEIVAKEAASAKITNTNEAALLREAEAALRPFYTATQLVQGHNTTTWDVLGALSVIHASITRVGTVAESAAAIIMKRRVQMFSPAVVLLAYLCPVIRGTDIPDAVRTLRGMHSMIVDGSRDANDYRN
jgi:hypothetical protein